MHLFKSTTLFNSLPSMASPFLLLLLLLLSSSASALFNNLNTSSSHEPRLSSLCKSTPYPSACLDSLTLNLHHHPTDPPPVSPPSANPHRTPPPASTPSLSISITIPPTILNLVIQSLNTALTEAQTLSHHLSNPNLLEKQRGTIQDCNELHQITLTSLKKSITRINSPDPNKNLPDARAFLAAALTNKNTCLEGLSTASGPAKSTLVISLTSTYMHVSNSLSLLSKPGSRRPRRLLGFPRWVSKRARRVLQGEYDSGDMITVAADGSGNFTTISDAINFAPNNSVDRVIVYVRQGFYEENVEIPSWKQNIVLLGDGRDVTVISGSRSVGDGWTTFRSATVAVSGEGFLARDITFDNAAGPEKHQAVALRINADLAAVYRCAITGYQDTLYVHSFRQFYRECDIYGTIDYIFGNAAVVFQGCNIVSRMPMPGQFTVVTAQSRDSPDEDTGISIQNCTVLCTDELYGNASVVRSYLGRPWREYSRTVYLESYIDGFIGPEGWTKWAGDDGLDTLYYGEYDNYGPGSGTGGRVAWLGYRVMGYEEASNFTVSVFISGKEWLDSTSFPYDDGV